MSASVEWPAATQWGVFVLLLIAVGVVVYAVTLLVVEWLARRDVRQMKKDKSR